MEFDLLVNFIPIFSIILFIIVTIFTVFQKLKLRWPVTLNCWFCNNNSKVSRQHANWWLCLHCEQYNGFSKNGDYAYSIPEQYKTSSHNNRRYCSAGQDTKFNKISMNRLCNQCTQNETLKLSKLSNYIPANERKYKEDIEQFKKSLEQKYPLCAQCKSRVHSVLYKQALWLKEYKMLLFKQRPFQVIASNKKFSEPIFRMISTIIDSMVAYNMDFVFLPIGGLFFQICACCVASASRKSCDVLLMFLWICIIILLPFKDSKIMKIDFHNEWFSLEYITQYHIIMFFTSIIGFINVKPKSYKNTMKKDLSFKKIGSPFSNSTLSDSCTTTLNDKHSFEANVAGDMGETIGNKSLPTITNDSMPFSIDKSKLKSVTQLPWVADGYWQNGMDLPSLSRSSSPSSGFGSVASNFAPSREPSIHECDQCSTISDFAQPCYTSRQTNISPNRAFNHQSSQFSNPDRSKEWKRFYGSVFTSA